MYFGRSQSAGQYSHAGQYSGQSQSAGRYSHAGSTAGSPPVVTTWQYSNHHNLTLTHPNDMIQVSLESYDITLCHHPIDTSGVGVNNTLWCRQTCHIGPTLPPAWPVNVHWAGTNNRTMCHVHLTHMNNWLAISDLTKTGGMSHPLLPPTTIQLYQIY
jgi:hypothetical protein